MRTKSKKNIVPSGAPVTAEGTILAGVRILPGTEEGRPTIAFTVRFAEMGDLASFWSTTGDALEVTKSRAAALGIPFKTADLKAKLPGTVATFRIQAQKEILDDGTEIDANPAVDILTSSAEAEAELDLL